MLLWAGQHPGEEVGGSWKPAPALLGGVRVLRVSASAPRVEVPADLPSILPAADLGPLQQQKRRLKGESRPKKGGGGSIVRERRG